MHYIITKKSALLNNRAFTLLEALMGMIVLSVLMMLICQMVIVLNTNMQSYYNKRQDVLFIMQTNREVLSSKLITASGDTLSFKKIDGETVTYTLKENEVIRQVDGSGYEVVLSNVEAINFYQKGKYYYMDVTHINTELQTYFICYPYY